MFCPPFPNYLLFPFVLSLLDYFYPLKSGKPSEAERENELKHCDRCASVECCGTEEAGCCDP